MKMKMLLIAAMMMAGSALMAHADDEISCATDNECIKAKVEAGEAQFKKNRAREKRETKKHESHIPASDDNYVPCAGDDDCQRTGQDAADRENGITGQDD